MYHHTRSNCPRSAVLRWIGTLLILLGTGCGGEGDDGVETDTSTGPIPDIAAPVDTVAPVDTAVPIVEGLTYHGEIRSVINARCGGCHVSGGAAPFPLENYEDVYDARVAVSVAVGSGIMPPWSPSNECRTYEGDRSLSAEEETAILEWIEDGAAEGVPTEVEDEPVETSLPNPDLLLELDEPYTPPLGPTDTYRCLSLNHTTSSRTFVRGLSILPDQKSIVHHVIVAAIPANSIAALEAKEESDPGPGYECFGTFGVGGAQRLGAWVPGVGTPFFKPGEVLVIEPGSRIVMQIHYNLLSAEPLPDSTRVGFYFQQDAPEFVLSSVFLINPNIAIPAGDPYSEHITYISNDSSETATVVAAGPHMHLRGKELSLDVVRVDGTSECALHVPDYDFNWQESFRFQPGEEAVVHPGDQFRLRCVYDNSEENQPVVDGVQVEPKDLIWGDGTEAEMCLAGITIRTPYQDYLDGVKPAFSSIAIGGPLHVCKEFTSCKEGCDKPNSYACIANCASESVACLQCVLEGLDPECGSNCYGEVDVVSCITQCVGAVLSGTDTLGDCMVDVCPEEMEAMNACYEPYFSDGVCDALFTKCSE